MIRGASIALFFALAVPTLAFKLNDNSTSGILTVTEGTSNVLSLRYGPQLLPGVDAKYTRSIYIHPLWSVDGAILTDDFPQDHPHHHGIFWAWPHVIARGEKTENWHPATPSLRHHFSRWIDRTVDATSTTISLENHWRLDDKVNVARETVSLHIHKAEKSTRAIDITLTIEALDEPVTLQGTPAENKGYGGLCFRAAPLLKGSRIETASGTTTTDIIGERTSWAGLAGDNHGVAVFSHPDHPQPLQWMARNSYAGFINASWPGLSPVTISPGQPITLKYRIFIDDGTTHDRAIRAAAYENYVNEARRISR